MPSPKYLLVESRLEGADLASYLADRRRGGDSLERIAKHIWADTGIEVTAMTVSNWLNAEPATRAAS
jgi:hypothetical protein